MIKTAIGFFLVVFVIISGLAMLHAEQPSEGQIVVVLKHESPFNPEINCESHSFLDIVGLVRENAERFGDKSSVLIRLDEDKDIHVALIIAQTADVQELAPRRLPTMPITATIEKTNTCILDTMRKSSEEPQGESIQGHSDIVYDSTGLQALLPDVNLDKYRMIPLLSHHDARLTIVISYSKSGFFEDSDHYEVLLIPKGRRENWGSGIGRSRNNRNGEGFSGSAAIRNLTSKRFDILFIINWKDRKGNGVFNPTLNALWKPEQNFEVDGVQINVKTHKRKKLNDAIHRVAAR